MYNLNIIKEVLRTLAENKDIYMDYINNKIRNNPYIEDDINNNIKFMIDKKLISAKIKETINDNYCIFINPNIESSGLKVLKLISNGDIRNINDLIIKSDELSSKGITIENNPTFNNNPNINVSPTFNNTNNVSNENNNISNIKDLIDLVTFVNTNSNIDDITKQDIINTIKEIENSKNQKDLKSYVDLYSKLLTSLQATLNISPFIIQGFEAIKNLF